MRRRAGDFEAWDLYCGAVAEAAEAENASVILGIGGVMLDSGWFDGRGLERCRGPAGHGDMTLSLTASSSMKFPRSAKSCAASGRFQRRDAGLDRAAYAEHARLTRQVVEAAHPIGVAGRGRGSACCPTVGEVGGEVGHMTDPDEAGRFVVETGVDALAVSVGNVHILLNGQSPFDRPRLAALRQAVSVPLALHGGSGFPDVAIPDALALGVAKVNFGSALKRVFLAGLVRGLRAAERVSYHQAVGPASRAPRRSRPKTVCAVEITRRVASGVPCDVKSNRSGNAEFRRRGGHRWLKNSVPSSPGIFAWTSSRRLPVSRPRRFGLLSCRDI